MDSPAPPLPIPVPEPSLKALGKRRLVEPGPAVRSSSPATLKKAKAADEGEKRVTRSSLGGAGDVTGVLGKDEGALSSPRRARAGTPAPVL